MKYRGKLTKIGGSYWVIVPSVVRKNLDLVDEGDVEIEINKIDEEKEVKRYRCKKCNLLFDSGDELPYCPSCECEDLETTYEEIGEL